MALDNDYFGGGGLDLSNISKVTHLNKVMGNEFEKSNKFQRTEAKEVLQNIIKAAQNLPGHRNKNRITDEELFGANGIFTKLKLNPSRYKKEFGLEGYRTDQIKELQNLLKYQAPTKVIEPEEDMENT